MKLRVPEGCRAASHAGRAIEIAEDGSVEMEDDARNVFILHGFIPWDGEETPNLAPMTRDELVTEAMKMTMKTVEAISTEDIRTRLAVADIEIEDISALSRRELFAFLRAKGVSLSLPVTNEALRAAARHALGA